MLGRLVAAVREGLYRPLAGDDDRVAYWIRHVRLGVLLSEIAAWAVVGSAADEHLNRITDLGFELVLAAGAFWALHQWLRSHREPCGQTDADHARARALVADHGEDSLSFFALRRDRRYMFSRAGNAFLAYRVVAGCALVAGDPIVAAPPLFPRIELPDADAA